MIEKLFDMTDFEQSLKEHADDFTIVPSRKVWQGIYNNIHPGRKWPSIPMIFMLLLSILGIGYLNHAPINPGQNDINLNEKSLSAASNSFHNTPVGDQLTVASLNKDYNPDKNYSQVTVTLKTVRGSDEKSSKGDEFVSTFKKSEHEIIAPDVIPFQKINSVEQQLSDLIIKNEILRKNENVEIESSNISETINSKKEVGKMDADFSKKETSFIVKSLKKKTPKVTFSYFIMPTVTNAYFAGNEQRDTKIEGSILTVNPKLSRPTMIVDAQLGLRLGGQVEYHINPKLQLLLMGQVSYSGYTVISNNQPLATSKLALKDKSGPVYSKAYITNYGNGKSENQVPLRNYSLQVSIPIGAQYEIWKNNTAAIFISAAAGPSLVLKSNAHLLSSDGRNYVDDQSLMRNSNYTGYLGTHVEFSATNLKWRIGPTVSYQLLSTYEDKYPVKEHLIDYGIKIGISK